MSVLKFFNRADQQPEDLEAVLRYIANDAKSIEDFRYGYGIGRDTALEDMLTVKILNRKLQGRQYFHGVLSFDRGVDKKTAFEAAKDALGFFGGNFQISAVLHENTGNLHVHFVMNSVGINGKKYSQSKTDLQKCKNFFNRILAEKGMSLIGKIEQVEEVKEEGIYEISKGTVAVIQPELMFLEELHPVIEFAEEDERPFCPITFAEEDERPFCPITFAEDEEKLFTPITFADSNGVSISVINLEDKRETIFYPIIFYDNEGEEKR